MDEKLKSNLTSKKSWLRLLYIVFFAVCFQVAVFVMWVLVALQFLFALFSGQDNRNLREFGQTLAEYIYQTLGFLTYNSDEKPFPFSDWPVAEPQVLEGEVELSERDSVDVFDEADYDESDSNKPLN